MSKIVTGYLNGHPQYRDQGPAAAAVQGHGALGLGEVLPTFHNVPQRRKPDPHASRKRRQAEARARKAEWA